MTKLQILFIPLVSVAVGILAGGCGMEPDGMPPRGDRVQAAREALAPSPPASRVQVGEEAPDFELTTTDGKQFKLSDQRGKVVLINFFATWCPPCLTEMPHLQKEVYEKVKSDQFTMIAIGREHDNAEVGRFQEKHRLEFPMAGDPKRAVFALYAEKSIPRILVVDRDGKVLFQSVGYSDKDFKDMLALIRAKMEERPK